MEVLETLGERKCHVPEVHHSFASYAFSIAARDNGLVWGYEPSIKEAHAMWRKAASKKIIDLGPGMVKRVSHQLRFWPYSQGLPAGQTLYAGNLATLQVSVSC